MSSSSNMLLRDFVLFFGIGIQTWDLRCASQRYDHYITEGRTSEVNGLVFLYLNVKPQLVMFVIPF